MISLHEFVLVIALHETVKHGRKSEVRTSQVNELYRTYRSCRERGREMDRVIKIPHAWTCIPVDQD